MEDDPNSEIRAIMIICAAVFGIVVTLLLGCASVFDAGKNTYDAYRQIEESKEARRKAEAERRAYEERQRVEAERKADEAERAKVMPSSLAPGAPYRVYKDGADWVFAYRGGAGLYKPESRLWLVGSIKASEVLTAGEYDATGRVVRWLRIGSNDGPRADGNQVIVENSDMYHSGQLKLRDAKVSASGNTLILICRDGRRLEKRIIDRDWRQE
jgi:hypothetical protein